MQKNNASFFICPECKGSLKYDSLFVCDNCGKKFPVIDNIVDFMKGTDLSPLEIKTIKEYEELAKSYDSLMNWVFTIFDENETEVRKSMAERLDVKAGSRVLEIGCGTGSDSVFIYEKIKPSGALFLLEISRDMIEIARNKIIKKFNTDENVFYALADVNELPFEDNFFDAAFHFGGLNVFPDPRKALSELNRVVKNGGKVVVGDESIPPWLRNTEYGKTVMEYNSQYKHQIPLEIIDEKARNVNIKWLIGNAFYLIDYVVSDKNLPLDMETKNPFFDKSVREWVTEKKEKI